MVIKEQIMLTAFDLFSEHGIKNVSMDDIAHNASISKRTLYELFEDTETRSHTDGFQRNNAKCLDEKGISRFVPHSSF